MHLCINEMTKQLMTDDNNVKQFLHNFIFLKSSLLIIILVFSPADEAAASFNACGLLVACL